MASRATLPLLLAAALSLAPGMAEARGSRHAIAGEVADAPHGFLEMCARDRVLCEAGNEPARFSVSPLEQPAPDTFRLMAAAWSCPGEAHLRPANLFMTSWPPLPTVSSGCTGAAEQPAATPSSEPDRKQASDLLRRVNALVNQSIWQVPDRYTSGTEELWRRPSPQRGATGDCEDIAIEKRMRLIEAGFPADRLFFAIAYKRGLGLHTVLAVRLSDADYVLDSAHTRVLRWDRANFQWLRLQTPGQPMRWTRAVTGEPALPMAALDASLSGSSRG